MVRFGYFLSFEEQRPEAPVRQTRSTGAGWLRRNADLRPLGAGTGEALNAVLDREAAKADPPLTISPEGMYRSQLNGKTCINCNKGWPAPRVQVGVFVGGGQAMACPECAPVVVAE